jgi:hypothetical protein
MSVKGERSGEEYEEERGEK